MIITLALHSKVVRTAEPLLQCVKIVISNTLCSSSISNPELPPETVKWEGAGACTYTDNASEA
jgi:hypothetical protein